MRIPLAVYAIWLILFHCFFNNLQVFLFWCVFCCRWMISQRHVERHCCIFFHSLYFNDKRWECSFGECIHSCAIQMVAIRDCTFTPYLLMKRIWRMRAEKDHLHLDRCKGTVDKNEEQETRQMNERKKENLM